VEPGQPLLRVRLPEMKEVEVYLIKLEDGSIVARTAEEIEKAPLPKSSAGSKGA
jgi:hypothetical protein